MSLNFLTAGESHGKALVGIIEGLPAGITVSESELVSHMQKRKMGYGRGSRQKIETDEVEILSGVRFGKTLGSPISLVIKNRDFENWEDVMSTFGVPNGLREVDIPRPGHADVVGAIKYKYKDLRNSLERASARETAMRVALGYFAKAFISEFEIDIYSRVVRIGDVIDDSNLADWEKMRAEVEDSDVRCSNPTTSLQMKKAIDNAKKEKDTLGGEFEVFARNLPIGLGSYSQWTRKVEAKVGASFLSLNAIKSVEIGLGKKSGLLKGSEVHDEMSWNDELQFKSNKCGGLLAGVTSGQPLVVRASMKPIATLMSPLDSFSWKSKESAKAHIERSDYCAVPAASVIGESLLALVLAELMLEKFGGDSIAEITPRVNLWKEQCRS